jgi:Fe-S oxidoreductase/nitrate reductase gamma subunit
LIPTRATETFSQYFGLMYGLMILAFIIFGKGVYDHYRLWRVGQPEDRRGSWRAGIGRFLRNTIGHSRILRKSYPGILHWLIFWAFIILALGTMSIATHEHTGLPTFQGSYYLVLSLAMNLLGLLAMVAIVLFLWRRYVTRPDGLDSTAGDWVAPVFIFLVMTTGFLLSGVRIAASPDPWAAWRPVAYFISTWFSGASPASLLAAHRDIWLVHMCMAMGFIAYLPYSKLFHIIAGPLNQICAKDVAAQSLQPLNLEDESLEQFGVAAIGQFTWKQLLDGDACIRCGRCQDNCPAYLSGKPLSPKKFTQDLKRCLEAVGPKLLVKQTAEESSKPLVPDVIGEEEVWACTTCRSCEEQCPMFVEHVPKIVDLRRNLVMMESSFPSEAQVAFRGMENNGNPWNVGWKSRVDWSKELAVPELAADPSAEYLFWPGCSGAFDNRNKKVATAVVQLLKRAGVSFAILGNEEKCCGDSARRLGNEYLYQTLAQENIETLNGYGVKKIVTSCPHCFNTLKNEYPQFGGRYEVIHHSVLLHSLIRAGRLTPRTALAATCTYHDSCYLGRYNDIYAEPRSIVSSIPGVALREMDRNRRLGFCCGAGGGRMWLDEPLNQRVNFKRTEEALETGADLIVTACPFCLTMLEDGIKAKDLNEKIGTRDIAEVLWESVQ